MEANLKLSKDIGTLLPNPSQYRRLIGCLIYLTITRPDITYLVQVLSQYMASPHQPHMDAALQVLRYLKQAPGQGLLYPSHSDFKLNANTFSLVSNNRTHVHLAIFLFEISIVNISIYLNHSITWLNFYQYYYFLQLYR